MAVRPETAKKLRSQGHQLFVQSGAGKAASAPDAAYAAVGVETANAKAAFGCDLVLKVRPPFTEELPLISAVLGLWTLRHLCHRPIFTGSAESAVEYVVDQHVKNKGHMRWSRRGANALLQVRCAVLNGIGMLNFMR